MTKPLEILTGNCLAVLKTLPGESVQCVVTSPPYWGLRDYGTEAQVWGGEAGCAHEWGDEGSMHRGGPTGGTSALAGRDHSARDGTGDVRTGCWCGKCGAWRGHLGSEPTVQLFIEHMVEIFREVRRVLKKDGTAWVNMGDSYNGAGKGGGTRIYNENGQLSYRGAMIGHGRTAAPGLKEKDLVGQPWRLAFGLQDDGWWLRQDIIWAKPNPMPESIRDRCTKSHEYIFLLSKSERYYFDAEAIKEPVNGGAKPRRSYKTPDGWDTSAGTGGHGSFHREGREEGATGYKHKSVPGNVNPPKGQLAYEAGDERHRTKAGLLAYANRARAAGVTPKSAPADSGVKANESFSAAVVDMVETRNKRSVWTVPTQSYKGAHFATYPEDLIKPCILAGTKPGDVVLDIFGGSGTTGQVALELGQRAVLIELNPEYVKLIEQRCTTTLGLALTA